ncbi:hypothetical protein OSTOST_23050, partial [Ostertagia ostertagi]
FYIFVDSDGIGVHVHPSTQDRFDTIVKGSVESMGVVSLADERVHLITLERKTPLGTRHASKKFDFYIDGVYNEIPDIAKYTLNNITVRADESGESNPVVYPCGIRVRRTSAFSPSPLQSITSGGRAINVAPASSPRAHGGRDGHRSVSVEKSSVRGCAIVSSWRNYSVSSYDGDGSIGTDDTDLNAYRDIPSHRVKVYRESMVSILVPGVDQPSEAIVKRIPSLSGQSEHSATTCSKSCPIGECGRALTSTYVLCSPWNRGI